MTLLITLFAAIISTICWYRRPDDKMNLGFLALMYWGASIMWLVDAAFAFVEEGAEAFVPAPAEMLNDAYLGLAVVALGMVIWLVRLLLADPKGRLKTALAKR